MAMGHMIIITIVALLVHPAPPVLLVLLVHPAPLILLRMVAVMDYMKL